MSTATATRSNGYQVRALAGRAEIFIFGRVGQGYADGITSARVVQDIKALGDVKQIDVRINCPGGYAFEGLAIHSLLTNHPATVTTHNDGAALSAGSIIFMAGSTRCMSESALLMLHNPMLAMDGTSDELRREADVLDKLTNSLVSVYAAATRLPGNKITEMLNREAWLDASEALKLGFCHRITPNRKVRANFSGTTLPARFSDRSVGSSSAAPVAAAIDSTNVSKATQFESLVAARMKDGTNRITASAMIARKHPDLHAAFLQVKNPHLQI